MLLLENKKLNGILAKKGIETYEDVLNTLPKSYIDYRKVYRSISLADAGCYGCFIGKFLNVKYITFKNNISCINIRMKISTRYINISVIGQKHLFSTYKRYKDNSTTIAVFGLLKHEEPYGFKIQNPDIIVPEEKSGEHIRITPQYKKIDGISMNTWENLLKDALRNTDFPTDSIYEKDKNIDYLPSTEDAYRFVHHPQDLSQIKSANQRLVFNRLLDFSLNLQEQQESNAIGTPVIIRTLSITEQILHSLPYDLTPDQKKYLNKMLQQIRSGKRVSALLQGDVGCGKTMVAFFLMLALAENGYQAVLMAPTALLASQHYEQIRDLVEPFNIKTAYINSSLPAKRKKEIINNINDGSVNIIIGTHALISDQVQFKNLGIAIIDEEHRFGTVQRSKLLSHGKNGTNILLMSATPIPRTLAGAMHGDTMDVYDIRTIPSARKPVQTAISNNNNVIFDFIEKQLAEGRQAYVVCPLIDKSDDDESSILSIEETAALYKSRFEPFYSVSTLSGKMNDDMMHEIIDDFLNNKTQILISTTIVEVGVNVPNASVMVIQNAERFGLTTMHQLRGRVGRGNYKGYCILKSEKKYNQRLLTLTSCNDGFRIAEEDLKLRGAGDIIGIKQSGTSKVMDDILSNKELYSAATLVAKEIVCSKNSLDIF